MAETLPSLARRALAAARSHPLAARWMAWPEERRDVLAVVLLGAVVFLPWLGAVGFWDPWEPHYAEVAREMIDRRDYVHPYWESAYFFSKPVLSLWLMVPMMFLAGTNSPEAGTGVYTEWLVRLPFASLAILAMALVYVALRRTMGRRIGLLSALVTATCPIYFLLARQAVTDMPFVALLAGAIACWMVGVLERDEPQPGWLYASYALMGVATLAKGLLGFMLPGAVIFLFLVVSGEWRMLLRMRIPQGAVIVLLIASPWIAWMSVFPGVDDESKTFFYRFFIHDHFNRLAKGVHTTTPGGTFAYYVEQLGFGIFPWVAAVPGALVTAVGLDLRDRNARAHLFVVCWALVTFALFAFATTKFHHYVLPMVPPVAILCAHFVDRLIEEGLGRFTAAILVGAVLFGLVAHDLWMKDKHLTDLFVYNYDRPYPDREVDPRRAFSAIFAAGGVVALWALPFVRRIAFALWAALLAAAAFFGFGARKPAPAAEGELPDDRRVFVAGLLILALGFGLYTSWHHWRKLTPHWTQRDLFWTYHHERRPGEPIIGYSTNWRGETFYSRNRVRQIMTDPERLKQAVALPGREWVICEQGRFAGMKQALGASYTVRVVDRSSNKFFLATVD